MGPGAAPRTEPTAPRWDHEATLDLTLADQCRDRYLPVPFIVPAGTESFEVTLEVIDSGDEASGIDLGCEGPNGWRGWSGGARSSAVIGAEDATPGYVPGPPEPGEWAVILGIHALPTGSTRVRVRVSSPAASQPDHGERPAPRDSARGSARGLPAPEGRTWVAADTHAHSLHSDGTLGLHELAACAVDSGLDVLCVTDHNTVSHHPLLPAVAAAHDIVLVPGQETTTHRGHANAYGDIGFIDFRRPVADWARTVAERGGLLSINHPVAGDCSWLEEVPDGVGGIEILHSELLREPISTAAVGWAQQVIAARGGPAAAGISFLAGADFHRPSDPIRPGTPATWLCVEELSPDGVLEAMRAGRTALTASVDIIDGRHVMPRLLDCPIALRRDERSLHVLDAPAHVLVDGRGRRRVIDDADIVVAAERENGPFRLEDAGRRTVALVA